MKNKMKLIALTLIVALSMSLLAACGGSDKDSDGGRTTGSDATTTSSSSGEQKQEQKEEKTIHPMRYVQPGNLPPDYETGIKAVNEKLQADGYDIEVEIVRIPWDAYDQKLNLMLSSGDEFELLHVMQDVKNISSLAIRDALLPIDDYLDKYPNLVSKFSEKEWQASRYKGQIYAVPVYWKSFDNAIGNMTVRTDVMKKFTDTFPDTPEGIIDLMKKMQAYIKEEVGKTPYHWPHQLSVPPSWLHRMYDTFPFYVENSLNIVLIRQDGTVDSYFESEEFKKDAYYYRQMYTAGLINPDILNATHEEKYDEVKIGAFLPSETFGYGDLVGLKENIPTADIEVMFTAPEKPNMIYTLAQNLNAVSATAEDPESGLKFLDWLYKSKENHDLFHYGIEGVHYTASADNRIDQKKDASNNVLYYMDTWMSGYLPFLRYAETMPEKGIEFDQFKSENYVVSPAAGFLFDATNVQSELAALQTEIIASIYPIKYGLVEYDEAFPAALQRLKAAGLDKYLEEYRTQFAKYLEENPDVLEQAKGTAK